MRPVRWGVLGCARIADGKVIPAIRASRNGVLHAVASRDRARAADFATRHAAPVAHASYEALLADGAVDAIYMPVPTGDHAAWAARCIAAGKPVLVEKPFAATVAEAQAVLDAAQAAGVPCGEAWMYRFHPLTRRAVAIVRGGGLGRVQALQAWFSADIPPGDLRWHPGPGGGAMADLGGYCTGILRLLMDAEPVAVRAVVAHRHGVDASVSGLLEFAGGVAGRLMCTMTAPFSCGYEVLGDQGRLRVDEGGMVAWPGRDFAIERWDAGGTRTHETIPAADHYQLMIEAFADGLRGGPAYPVGRAETLANLAVMESLLADARRA